MKLNSFFTIFHFSSYIFFFVYLRIKEEEKLLVCLFARVSAMGWIMASLASIAYANVSELAYMSKWFEGYGNTLFYTLYFLLCPSRHLKFTYLNKLKSFNKAFFIHFPMIAAKNEELLEDSRDYSKLADYQRANEDEIRAMRLCKYIGYKIHHLLRTQSVPGIYSVKGSKWVDTFFIYVCICVYVCMLAEVVMWWLTSFEWFIIRKSIVHKWVYDIFIFSYYISHHCRTLSLIETYLASFQFQEHIEEIKNHNKNNRKEYFKAVDRLYDKTGKQKSRFTRCEGFWRDKDIDMIEAEIRGTERYPTGTQFKTGEWKKIYTNTVR